MKPPFFVRVTNNSSDSTRLPIIFDIYAHFACILLNSFAEEKEQGGEAQIITLRRMANLAKCNCNP
jgi:hypothetical protein